MAQTQSEVDVVKPFLKAFTTSLVEIQLYQGLPPFDKDIAKQVFKDELNASYETVRTDMLEAQSAFLGYRGMTTQVMRVGVLHEGVRMAKMVYERMGVKVA